jgi:hypothetical protein
LLAQASVSGDYDIDKYKMRESNMFEDKETIMSTHVTFQDFNTEEETKQNFFQERSNEYSINDGTMNNQFTAEFLDDLMLTNT